MWWWWWAWVAFVFFLLVLPWGYGWGRRGWGPPYPRYYRRRTLHRGTMMAPEPRDTAPDTAGVPPMRDRVPDADPLVAESYPGYGFAWLADLLWLGVLAAIAWAVFIWVT